MKNFKLYSCAAMIAAASMFTSCMEQSNKTSGATFGIISTMDNMSGGSYAKTASGNITSSNGIFEEAISGDCCLFNFDIDFDNQPVGHPANYVDAFISNYTVVKKYQANSYNTENESTYLPKTNEIPFSGVAYNALVENTIFIGCEFKEGEGQINDYDNS